MDSNDNPYAPPGSAPPAPPPDADPRQPVLATRWQRFAATLVDNLVTAAVAIPLFIFMNLLGNTDHPDQDSFLLTVIQVLVGIVAYMVLNGWLLATRAQTIGKRLLGTRIVTLDGRPASLDVIVLRRLAPLWVLSAIPVVSAFGLVDVLFIFREDHRCIHDHLAGTMVVRAR
jgi:uncharacterized RDD family membrane protein YckC